MSSVDLGKASEAGDVNEVKRILKVRPATTYVDAITDNMERTALMRAACSGRLEVVKYLVQEAGADKNRMGAYTWSPLLWAACHGQLQVVKYLVQDAGAYMSTDCQNGNTLSMVAACQGHLEVVKYLVQDAGTHKDSVNKNGATALMQAASCGHLEVVRYLVQEAGADKDKADKDRHTALMLAAQEGHLEVVKVLVQAGADKEKKNKNGKTALDLAKTEEIKCFLRLPSPVAATGFPGMSVTSAPNSTGVPSAAASTPKSTGVPTAAASTPKSTGVPTAAASAPNSTRVPTAAASAPNSSGVHTAASTPKSTGVSITSAASATNSISVSITSAASATNSTGVFGNMTNTTSIRKLRAVSSVSNRTGVPDTGATATLPPPPLKSAFCPPIASLTECERVLQQVADAPQRRDLNLRIQALQPQLRAAEVSDDFEQAAILGTQLQALQQQSAQLPLSEEDYLTLPARHAELVRRVTDTCRELMKGRDYAALGPLSAKLKELRAVDLSGIPGMLGKQQQEAASTGTAGRAAEDNDGADDPVVVVRDGEAEWSGGGGEDDGANDPVIVSFSRG